MNVRYKGCPINKFIPHSFYSFGKLAAQLILHQLGELRGRIS